MSTGTAHALIIGALGLLCALAAAVRPQIERAVGWLLAPVGRALGWLHGWMMRRRERMSA